MRAVVVYESHWGNTAAIARAIAEGLGSGTEALTTSDARPEALAGIDLIVAGSPLLGFALPTEAMLKGMANNAANDPTPPDLTHPSMRAWLEELPLGVGCVAAFETRIWWSPGSAAKAILRMLEEKGYRRLDKPRAFVVTDKYGPLREGEGESARAWGAELARMLEARQQAAAGVA